MLSRRYWVCVVVLLGAVFLSVFSIYEGCFLGNDGLFLEGGFVEWVTAFCFAFAGVLLVFLGIGNGGVERGLTFVFGATCFVMFLREVDVEDYNVPAAVEFLGSGVGRDVLFVLVYVLLFGVMFLRERGALVGKVLGCFRSGVARVVLLGCLCLLVGLVFEGNDWKAGEELVEMNGALLILLGALLHINVPISDGEGFRVRG